ncbi:MAG: cytochrome P450 [Pseudomonadota bacterium]
MATTEARQALRDAHAQDISLADLEVDPYPILARLREEAPLAWVPNLEMWLATRWDDVAAINRQPELFTADTEPSFLAEAIGESMLTKEGDEARRLKAAFKPPVTAGGRAGRYFADEIARVCDELIDRLAPKGACDVLADFATPLATISLQRILGLDHLPWEKVWDLCSGVCVGIANFEKDAEKQAISDQANAELEDVITEKIAQVCAEPDASALSHYANEAAGVVSDREIVNNVRLMISGGINEPRDAIGSALYAFLALDRGAAPNGYDEGFWRRFVREVLRYFAPVGTSGRMTTQSVELAGLRLPPGEFVAGCLSSANRDGRAFVNPDTFNPDREEAHSMAFSQGQHTCLGMYVGNQQVLYGCARFVERLSGLRLAPGFAPDFRGFEFRGLARLDVIYETG